jgi:transposase InsO family protein
MREIVNERRPFGYRRLAIMLKREGKGMNLKKVYRLYREKRLTVRKRGGRKRALGTRAPMAIQQEPNLRCSLDFVSDSLACGRRFRMLNVINDYSRNAWRASSIPCFRAGVSSASWALLPSVAGCCVWWPATTSYVGKQRRILAKR